MVIAFKHLLQRLPRDAVTVTPENQNTKKDLRFFSVHRNYTTQVNSQLASFNRHSQVFNIYASTCKLGMMLHLDNAYKYMTVLYLYV